MGAGYSIQARANDTAEIYIYEDVGAGWFGGVSAKQFADDLKAIGAVSTIHLRINSYGGEVFDGLAIYRQLVEHSARIIVHIDGVAASIASVIAMSGDEIRMAEAGFLMIHPAQGGVLGSADDMREMADLLEKITAAIATIYQDRTGADLAKIQAWVAADTWFTAEEALAAGFVDTLELNMLLAAKVEGLDGHRQIFADQLQQVSANREALRRPANVLADLRQVADQPLPAKPAAKIPAAPEQPEGQAKPTPLFSAANQRLARMRAKLQLSA